MLALVILTILGLAAPPAGRVEPGPWLQRVDMPPALHSALMQKLGIMGKAGQGVVNEDISTMLAPFFPKGQKIEDTRKVAREKGLGELQRFKGRTDAKDGEMYVTQFSVTRHMSDVFVVLQFGFERSPEAELVLDHVAAYLRSNNM